MTVIAIPIPVYRDRADAWLRDADRAWRSGHVQSAIAAAEEARDGLNGLLAAMRGSVRAEAFAVTREAQR